MLQTSILTFEKKVHITYCPLKERVYLLLKLHFSSFKGDFKAKEICVLID